MSFSWSSGPGRLPDWLELALLVLAGCALAWAFGMAENWVARLALAP